MTLYNTTGNLKYNSLLISTLKYFIALWHHGTNEVYKLGTI